MPNTLLAKFLLFSACLLPLMGCQTNQLTNCVEQDWYEIGRRSGASGDLEHNLDNEFKSCSTEEKRKAVLLYRNGRALGLSQFCKPVNGFELGRRNIKTNNVCPERSYKEFNDAYNKGRKLYNLNDESAKLRQKATELQDKKDKSLLSEIQKLETQILQINKSIKKFSKAYSEFDSSRF